ESLRFGIAETVVVIGIGHPSRVAPHQLSVCPPVTAEGPARKGLARIPLALSEVQEPARSAMSPQSLDENSRQPQLFRTERVRVPLFTVHVTERNERRLASHRQPDIACRKLRIDLFTDFVQPLPLLFAIRLRNAGILVNARHAHFVDELDFAF